MAGRPKATTTTPVESTGAERLQKVLAARGVASRRAAEELIREGRVTVDGRVVLEVGTKVDPERAAIKVDGRSIKQPRLLYLLLNKPRGYLTTANDPEGRRTIFDLLDQQDVRERVYPVGRLDMDSEGLLLLTNDGALANRIAHPRYRIDKEYNALVEGTPPPTALARLRRGGFEVEGRRTSTAEVTVIGPEAGGTWLRVIIHEGRKHQIRRMMEEVGHPVRRLRRVRLGPLTLAGLPAATYRPLAPAEVGRLQRLLGLAGDEVGTDTPVVSDAARPPTPPAQTNRPPQRTPVGPRGNDGGAARQTERKGDRRGERDGQGQRAGQRDEHRSHEGRPARPRRPGASPHHRH